MKPPYTLTPDILRLLTSIGERLGQVKAATLHKPQAVLRRKNRIRTIHGTLGIEGNALNEEQITAVLEGRRVLAKNSELREVTNAIAVYDALERFDPFKPAHFLKAHGLLMAGLVPDAGSFRKKAVGIMHGRRLAHLAPPAHLVPVQVKDLLRYLADDPDPMLIKSCVAHYEIEFIHPFTDGNGRMGRLWQTIALLHFAPVFAYLPIEAMIRERQKAYYAALAKSDRAGNAAPFIAFMLEAIERALSDLLRERHPQVDATDRLQHFLEEHGTAAFDRKTYMALHPKLSMATASRDLRQGLQAAILSRTGDGRTTLYRPVSGTKARRRKGR